MVPPKTQRPKPIVTLLLIAGFVGCLGLAWIRPWSKHSATPLFTFQHKQTDACVTYNHKVDGAYAKDQSPTFEYDCTARTALWTMDPQTGQIRHVDSGMCLVPRERNGAEEGTPVMLTDECASSHPSELAFTFTEDGSLKHEGTGLCVHPAGGTASQGKGLVLHPSCGEERIQFEKQPFAVYEHGSMGTTASVKPGLTSAGSSGDCSCPPPPCLDVLVTYHRDDRHMLVDNGGLESAMTHLQGVRKFFILSAHDSTLSSVLRNDRVAWIDERRAPFSRGNWTGAKRPQGWLFQQALKLWAVLSVEEMCNDVLIMDSDIMWIRDFDVRAPVEPPRGGWPPCTCPPPPRIKYNLASMDTGAWYGDITNPEYHHFVNWLLGMPKVLADTHTAINNWQVMQRDVLARLEASLQSRGKKSIQHALVEYGKQFDGMSEYEAYFSFLWYHYRDRVEPVYMPWKLREYEKCNYHNKTMLTTYQQTTQMMYFTCHDNFGGDDYYINCKGREVECNPVLASRLNRGQ